MHFRGIFLETNLSVLSNADGVIESVGMPITNGIINKNLLH